MTYPHVKQFETLALEAEAQERLARDRRAAAPKRPRGRSWHLGRWLRLTPCPRPEPEATAARQH
jgi:hypothetical protein